MGKITHKVIDKWPLMTYYEKAKFAVSKREAFKRYLGYTNLKITPHEDVSDHLETQKFYDYLDSGAMAILFLCEFKRSPLSLRIVNAIPFNDYMDALDAFANIPNPESQLITGVDKEELTNELNLFFQRKDTPEFLNTLAETI